MNRREKETHLAFMSKHMIQLADLVDELRIENEQLRLRGNRLRDAVEANDGTIPAAWDITNAIAAWQEYAEAHA